MPRQKINKITELQKFCDSKNVKLCEIYEIVNDETTIHFYCCNCKVKVKKSFKNLHDSVCGQVCSRCFRAMMH